MIECIPNLWNLNHSHLRNPTTEKIIPIDFRNLDFTDLSGVDISFKACKTEEDLADWYVERCPDYPTDLIPYLVFKTLYPNIDVPLKTQLSFYKKIGNYFLKFK